MSGDNVLIAKPLSSGFAKILLISVSLLVAPVESVSAQNWSATGQNWSSGWGFSSVGDRSLQLQQAQAMLAARNAGQPTSIVNNDNRQNYQENHLAAGASNNAEMVSGGKTTTTYSVGSLTNGTTEISVTGDNNDVTAGITADNTGCVDGSMSQFESATPNLDASFGIDISVAAAVEGMTC